MRYLILFASIVIQICIGGLYAWSGFVDPLRHDYGLSATQTQIIFGAIIAVFTCSMVFAGRLQERRGPRIVSIIGGLLFGGGFLVASASGGAFLLMLLGIGVISGAGIGFCYVSPLATCVKWFPKSKGLVTGLAVAGVGGGAILLTALSGAIIGKDNNVLDVFRIVGITYGIILVACAMFLRSPADKSRRQEEKLPLRWLLGQRRFWSLASGMFCGTFSGLMIVGAIKPIGMSAGLNPEQAGTAIGAFAIGSASGRICWGLISDRIGRLAIPLSLIMLCISVLLLLPAASSGSAFALAAALTGFGYGACFVVYAARVAAEYGPSAIGDIYPIVFLAYGFSGIVGPPVGGILYDATGNYKAAMMVAAIITASGIVATTLLARQRTKPTTIHPHPTLTEPLHETALDTEVVALHKG